MAIYIYGEGNPDELRAESVGLFGRNIGDVEKERHRLVNAGMNAALRREGSAREVARQLGSAANYRLPIEFVSRMLDPQYYAAPVMHARTGLAMYAPRGEDTPNFEILSEEVEDLEERIDPAEFTHLALHRTITHDALQYELTVSDDRGLGVRAHESFGFMGVNGYEPVVTVLHPDHPLRQRIEEVRQLRD